MSRIHNIMNLQKEVFDNKFSSLMNNVEKYVSDDYDDRRVKYLLTVHRKINEIITNLDEINLDIKSKNNYSNELLEDMKNYIIDERVREKFLPYMFIYRMALEQNYDD